MRAGLSTIQQTLTSEAASVLNQSIAEAGRRNHGQTTPLHVASTLLASSSGYLRQACIRSHPNSSHPLQCRALELCFSVALDRLPAAQSASPSPEPPISNALMAALKRAQAHQRRGCPEQQQQPLLAVKVELEQLIISILDDPSVSRVMREASFSSPAVKAAIEQSLLSSNNSASNSAASSISSSGLGFRPTQMVQMANRNSYMNPRLQQQQQQGNSDQSGGGPRRDDAKKVIDIMLKNKKRNPVLVGDGEPEFVVRELLQRIERKEVGESLLRNVQVVSLEKEFSLDRAQIPMKLKELERKINDLVGGAGVILNLGDLKWLVEQPTGFGGSGSVQAQQQIASEIGRVVVADIGKLLSRFREGNDRLWMIGTATCETYLRCQVYHPSMEVDWDLQALPIAARTPLPGLFPRMGGNGILSRSVESLSPMNNFPTMMTPLLRPESRPPVLKAKCCPLCMQNYEQELAQMKKEDSAKSSCEAKPEAAKQLLPQWLQIAKPDNGNATMQIQSKTKDEETLWKLKTEEVLKKWSDKCSSLHPSFHQKVLPGGNGSASLAGNSLYNSRLLGNQGFQPKLHSLGNLEGMIRMNQNLVPERPALRELTPLQSPIVTDLALGRPLTSEGTTEKTQPEPVVRDFMGCIPSEPEERFMESKKDKLANILDPDSFKSLFKGLAEKVSWQNEAASLVAAAVIQGRSGNSRRAGFGWKGDTWLLFAGPDRVGKKKMAVALSELLCRSSPVTIRLGSHSGDNEETDTNFRGKTSLDRIAEAVQRNPSSVIVLEDFDQADMLLRGSIKRAFERGRLPDSHGREISLKNVVFILTADGSQGKLPDLPNQNPIYEDKLANLSRQGWQLHLSVTSKSRKRSADWLQEKRPTKSRTDEGSKLGFDLNEAATAEDSLNSSDLTVEHDQEHNPIISIQSPIVSIPRELLSCVDEAIVFKPVDFVPLKARVTTTIATKFSTIIGEQVPIELDNKALEQLVGGIWFGKTELDEWAEKVLVPSFHKLKSALPSSIKPEDSTVVKLTAIRDSEKHENGDLLPNKITVSAGEGSS